MKIGEKEISDLSDKELLEALSSYQEAEDKRNDASKHPKFDKESPKYIGEFPPINPEFAEIKKGLIEEIEKRNLGKKVVTEEVSKVEDVFPEVKPVEEIKETIEVKKDNPPKETIEAVNHITETITLFYKKNEILKYVCNLNIYTQKEEIEQLYQYTTEG